MTLLYMCSRSSVDRALARARCSGGHGFDSCRELRSFSLSHARVMLINLPFTKKKMLVLNMIKDDQSTQYERALLVSFPSGLFCEIFFCHFLFPGYLFPTLKRPNLTPPRSDRGPWYIKMGSLDFRLWLMRFWPSKT